MAKHTDVFGYDYEQQDQLWKLTLPKSEATKVLRQLDDYNINEFSLFQSEDALLSTLATRHVIS
ncbi:hypothetical protein [Methylogaea oryzae]|uniref:hypothetical protein n=1 Tax=Methylogaea oryzae TaxID=1295382 RepID=UPI0012E15E37|nr:hypothetical protein [Methylogaea oryzae]